MSGAADSRALLTLLGVDERASWEQVRAAFRRAVRATHPDLHAGDPDAERRLKTLNGAWELVNTPAKWSEWVARLHARDAASDASTHADPTRGRLRVHREQKGSSGMRRWMVELDGEVIGTVANGGASRLDAAPGLHRLRVFYDWYSSAAVNVRLRAGEEAVFGCRQPPRRLLGFRSPRRALVLEPLPTAPRRTRSDARA